ncbi:DUF1616 domain-containing protein [Haloarcula amylovorans]|uniref:DUF1616 domain-containing protein n=1 Tax=Haloarcula amylovorans TaxID=2562280 RepID=UPI001430FE2A|nr:DUF1616 domain-containing protein [Halomicroarcula amylolytica]
MSSPPTLPTRLLRWLRTGRYLRYRVPVVTDPLDNRAGAWLGHLLILGCLLVAVGTIGYGFTKPTQDAGYTEFAVFTEEGGELIAAEYPSQHAEDGTVVVRVSNHEGRTLNYTVVAVSQRVDGGEQQTPTIQAQSTLGRRRLALSDNETGRARFDVTGGLTGGDVRVAFLLYRGDTPESPRRETAYRSLYVWVS